MEVHTQTHIFGEPYTSNSSIAQRIIQGDMGHRGEGGGVCKSPDIIHGREKTNGCSSVSYYGRNLFSMFICVCVCVSVYVSGRAHMALITLDELLTVKPEADQLSLCHLPTMRGLQALITGGAMRGGEGWGCFRVEGEEGRRWVKDRTIK